MFTSGILNISFLSLWHVFFFLSAVIRVYMLHFVPIKAVFPGSWSCWTTLPMMPRGRKGSDQSGALGHWSRPEGGRTFTTGSRTTGTDLILTDLGSWAVNRNINHHFVSVSLCSNTVVTSRATVSLITRRTRFITPVLPPLTLCH